MAYALGFPKDVTALIASMRDWRYEMVKAGGKTPSARCMPEPIETLLGPPMTGWMVTGKLYMQRIDYCRYYGETKTHSAAINIWKGVSSGPKSSCFWGNGVITHRFPDVCRANERTPGSAALRCGD